MQCLNCQHFGHTAKNFSRRFRCIKCPDKHEPGKCPTDEHTREDINRRKPSCVNCGKNHPANYRGCQAYINLIKLKQVHLQQVQDQQRFRQQSAHTYRTPGVNFAQVMHNGTNNTTNVKTPTLNVNSNETNDENCFNFIQREGNNVFGTDLFTLQRQIKSFAPKYRALYGEQKQQALIEFVLSITPI